MRLKCTRVMAFNWHSGHAPSWEVTVPPACTGWRALFPRLETVAACLRTQLHTLICVPPVCLHKGLTNFVKTTCLDPSKHTKMDIMVELIPMYLPTKYTVTLPFFTSWFWSQSVWIDCIVSIIHGFKVLWDQVNLTCTSCFLPGLVCSFKNTDQPCSFKIYTYKLRILNSE